jgi:hypothetical protein
MSSIRFLQRDHLLVAGHNGNCTEFHTFGQVHRADRDAAHGRLDLVGRNSSAAATAGMTTLLARFNSPSLRTTTPHSSGILRRYIGEPFSDPYGLSIGIGEGSR